MGFKIINITTIQTLSEPCLFALYEVSTKKAMVWYTLCPYEMLYRLFKGKHRLSGYVRENITQLDVEVIPCPIEESNRRLEELKLTYINKGYTIINNLKKYSGVREVIIEVRVAKWNKQGSLVFAVLRSKGTKKVVGVFEKVPECEAWIAEHYPLGWMKVVISDNELTKLYRKNLE